MAVSVGRAAAKSPLAMVGSKLALNHARGHGVAASLQQLRLLQSASFNTDEIAQANAAGKAKTAAKMASECAPLATTGR